jgi:hypothetical protein
MASKKSKKSHRRGTPAAGTAQPLARRDGGQATPAPAAVPPGLRPAKSVSPGLVLEANQYATQMTSPLDTTQPVKLTCL